MGIELFYIEPADAGSGIGRHVTPRNMAHARAILIELHRKGIDNAWVTENEEYRHGYIRVDDNTVWD